MASALVVTHVHDRSRNDQTSDRFIASLIPHLRLFRAVAINTSNGQVARFASDEGCQPYPRVP